MTVKTTELDKNTLLRLFRTMQVIRQCEERLAKSHQRGLVHGACHTYVGEEAIATGVFAHLGNEDVVFSTHRGHGHALAKGLHPGHIYWALRDGVDRATLAKRRTLLGRFQPSNEPKKDR